MRKIKDLLEQNERVWIYLKSDQETRDFMRDAKAEGFRWLNGDEIPAEDRGHIIGIQKDLRIGHVSMYIWGMAFQCDRSGAHTPMRVDYGLYRAGEENFVCQRPGISGFLSLSAEKDKSR